LNQAPPRPSSPNHEARALRQLRSAGEHARSCAAGKAVHVPRPSNLITVPSCDSCNHGASDDEVFRNEFSIMASSFGESAEAAERLQTALRGIRRNRATLGRMVLSAKPVERYSKNGLYLGLSYAVPAVPGVQLRVITRIVRGLYWHHIGSRVPNDAKIELVFIDKRKPDWEEGLSLLDPLMLRHILIGDGRRFNISTGRPMTIRPFRSGC
jgi:hypothetical protein